MKMRLPKDQPFWTSVILHVVVLLGLFLVTIVQAFKPKEKPHVFEMVDLPSEVTQSQNTPPSPQPPVEVPPVELPPVPQVDIPPPQPTPRPTVTPVPVEPAPLMDIRDFRRDNPIREPQSRQTQPRQQIDVPRIDVPELVIPQTTPSNPSPQITPQQRSALADYSSRLRSKIDAAWAKPAQLAGVRLVAEVVFDVSASGRISNVRLRSSSGNAAFDQSILAAFRRVASAGPTPTGQAHSFTLPFRMLD